MRRQMKQFLFVVPLVELNICVCACARVYASAWHRRDTHYTRRAKKDEWNRERSEGQRDRDEFIYTSLSKLIFVMFSSISLLVRLLFLCSDFIFRRWCSPNENYTQKARMCDQRWCWMRAQPEQKKCVQVQLQWQCKCKTFRLLRNTHKTSMFKSSTLH